MKEATSMVLCYALYNRDVKDSIVSKWGIFLTREAAEKALVYRAEEYCINEIGLNNFVRGQLDNPELEKTLYSGFVLKTTPQREISVSKRVSSVWSFYDSLVCYFGILSIGEENRLDQMSISIDPIQLARTIKVTKAEETLSKNKKSQVMQTGYPMTFMDKFQAELKAAVKKQAEKLVDVETTIN